MSQPTPFDRLSNALHRHALQDLQGSAFDNAFAVFASPPEDNNLVVLGTNGNASDEKEVLEALFWQAENPTRSSVLDGKWGERWGEGESPLQKQLKTLPEQLSEACWDQTFKLESTVFTNALLLATPRVSDIPKAVRERGHANGRSRTTRQLFDDCLSFFVEGTLALAQPKLIFCYGNAVSDHSSWLHLTRFAEVVGEPVTEPRAGHPARFAKILIGGDEIPVVGWPHLSYRYNAVDPAVIRRGLERL